MRSVPRAKVGAIALLLLFTAGCAGPPASGRGLRPTKPATSETPNTIWTGFSLASGVTCPDIGLLGLSRMLLTSMDSRQPAGVVLCDAKDLLQPRNLPSIQLGDSPVFVAPSKVGYESSNDAPIPAWATTTIKLNLSDGHTETMATEPGLMTVGWSHDQTMLAYLNDTGVSQRYWLQRIGKAPIALTPTIPTNSHQVGEADQLRVAFSPDDRYVLFVDTWVHRLEVFQTADGAVVYAAPSGDSDGLRTMAVWAHKTDRFYFKDDRGVYTWDPIAGVSSFAPGLRWRWPVLSQDDRYLAYTVWDKNWTPRVEVRDLAGGVVATSLNWRGTLGFTPSGTLLEAEQEPCPPDSRCPVPFSPTGKTLALQLGSMVESAVTPAGWLVDDIWPHP